MIAVLDYKIGNIGSVSNMLRHIGVKHVVADSPEKLENADKIILPGIGSFDPCVKALRESGLSPTVERMVLSEKKHVLGICAGGQIFGEGSEEGIEKGLGWVKMRCRKFIGSYKFKVPNMGWRAVEASTTECPLLREMPTDLRFYFVHSYFMHPEEASIVSMISRHEHPFAAGVMQDNIHAVQFHPEKSHQFGKQLFKCFAELKQ